MRCVRAAFPIFFLLKPVSKSSHPEGALAGRHVLSFIAFAAYI
jgi:hypothetical protein